MLKIHDIILIVYLPWRWLRIIPMYTSSWYYNIVHCDLIKFQISNPNVSDLIPNKIFLFCFWLFLSTPPPPNLRVYIYILFNGIRILYISKGSYELNCYLPKISNNGRWFPWRSISKKETFFFKYQLKSCIKMSCSVIKFSFRFMVLLASLTENKLNHLTYLIFLTNYLLVIRVGRNI